MRSTHVMAVILALGRSACGVTPSTESHASLTTTPGLLSYTSTDMPLELTKTSKYWREIESSISVPDAVTVSGVVVDLHATVPRRIHNDIPS